MGVAGNVEKRKRRPLFVGEYPCIAVCVVGLVLLAFILAYPLRYLFAKPEDVGNGTDNLGVKGNGTDDSVRDGILDDIFDLTAFSSTRNPPLSEPTPSPTTAEPTTTTQLPMTPTAAAMTTSTTKEPSTVTAAGTRKNGRRHSRDVIGLSSINHINDTNSSTAKEDVHGKMIRLQVVYDCYCPRSRQFIVTQLLPVYEMLRDYLNLTLLPYSRVSNETVGNSTALDVGCKPDNKQCQSSMLQTCIMTHANETLTAVKVIACMSSSADPHEVGRTCVKEYGLEWKMVELCVTEEGKLYMLEVSQKVWRITGAVGRVPLVSVQGKETRVVEVEAETNLLDLVCDHMDHGHEACAGSRNGTALSMPFNVTGKHNTTKRLSSGTEESAEHDGTTIGRP